MGWDVGLASTGTGEIAGADWPERLAGMVADAQQRRAKRRRDRWDLAARRRIGVARRHAAKLRRTSTDPLTDTSTAPAVTPAVPTAARRRGLTIPETTR
jgi:hypothetical protein